MNLFPDDIVIPLSKKEIRIKTSTPSIISIEKDEIGEYVLVRPKWFSPAEKKPPKDRPFLTKIKTPHFFKYRLIFTCPNTLMIEMNGSTYSLNECEKWTEIPGDDG